MIEQYIVQYELRKGKKIWAVGTLREAVKQCAIGQATSMRPIYETESK